MKEGQLARMKAVIAFFKGVPRKDLPPEVPLTPRQFDDLAASSGMTRAELERIGYVRVPVAGGEEKKA